MAKLKEGDACPLENWKCEGVLIKDPKTKTLYCPECCWEEGQDKSKVKK